MLLTTDWHPWFSYEWWNDIGVAALGALGSISVGAGAIVVALHSNRMAEAARGREEAAKAAQAAARDRAARGDFALGVTAWFTAAVEATVRKPAQSSSESASAGSVGRPLAGQKHDLDIRAATLGQHSSDLLATLDGRLGKLNEQPKTKQRGAFAAIVLRFSISSIQSWISDADAWWADEQKARQAAEHFAQWVESSGFSREEV